MIAMRVFFAVNNLRKKNIIQMILDMTIYFNNKKINSIRAEQQLIVSFVLQISTTITFVYVFEMYRKYLLDLQSTPCMKY